MNIFINLLVLIYGVSIVGSLSMVANSWYRDERVRYGTALTIGDILLIITPSVIPIVNTAVFMYYGIPGILKLINSIMHFEVIKERKK